MLVYETLTMNLVSFLYNVFVGLCVRFTNHFELYFNFVARVFVGHDPVILLCDWKKQRNLFLFICFLFLRMLLLSLFQHLFVVLFLLL